MAGRNSRTIGAAIKMTIFAAVSILVVVTIAATLRPVGSNQATYAAVFTSASRLQSGDQVRIAGVVVGQVRSVAVDSDDHARVTFAVDHDVPVTTGTHAEVKYLDIMGNRYLSLSQGPGGPLPVGGAIPIDHTSPALDLNVLFNGFKPLFVAISPKDVNGLANDIVQTLQGEGGTIDDLMAHTASLTSGLADREQAIGRVVTNLNVVLGTVDQRNTKLNQLVVQLTRFVGGLAKDRSALGASLDNIDKLSATTAALLREARPGLHTDVSQLRTLTATLSKKQNMTLLETALTQVGPFLGQVIRTASYGAFFNYYLCDVRIRLTNTKLPGILGVLNNKVLNTSSHDPATRCDG